MNNLEETRSRFSSAPWIDKASYKIISIYGLGGIGSHTALGINKIFENSSIFIFDFDHVSLSNIGGQIYNLRDIGDLKIYSLKRKLLVDNVTNSIYDYKKDEILYSDIIVSALDSMSARKELFDKICRKRSLKNSLFIDARMSADTIQIIAFRVGDKKKRTKYRKKYLFNDEQADETVCSYKQTYFVGQMISGLINSIITNYLTTLSTNNYPQKVPFYTEFYTPLMSYSSEI